MSAACPNLLRFHRKLESPPPQVKAELTRFLYEQLPSALRAALLVMVVTIIVLWNEVHEVRLMTWAVLIGAVSLLRSVLRARFNASGAGSLERFAQWRTRFIFATALASVCWASASILLPSGHNVAGEAFVMLMLGGVSTGAVASLAASRAAFHVFMIPILGSMIVRCIWVGDDIHLGIASAIAVMIVVLSVMHDQMRRSLIESLQLRSENIDLVNPLSRAQAKLETTMRN